MDDLQKFYDYFAKGHMDNGWHDTSPIRLSLLSCHGSVARSIEERPESDKTFPLERTRNVKFHLDARNKSIGLARPDQESIVSYESHSMTDEVVSMIRVFSNA